MRKYNTPEGEEKIIYKFVVTGGPCGGKSSALLRLREAFASETTRVLFVPETATELITSGVAPWTCGTNRDYQKCQIRLQLFKERIYEEAAVTMDAARILLLCDRGLMDNRVYIPDDYEDILREIGCDEEKYFAEYDAVFHLVTAAKGAAASYTTANNAARIETPEEAAAMDDAFIAAWNRHPHFQVIDNSTDFDGKMARLIAAVRRELERNK